PPIIWKAIVSKTAGSKKIFVLAPLTRKCTPLRKQTPTRRSLLPTSHIAFHHNRSVETARMLATFIQALPVALSQVRLESERSSPWPHLRQVLTSRNPLGAP